MLVRWYRCTQVGFTGGLNIGEEYCREEIGGTGHFRDTHMKVEGPAVQVLDVVIHLRIINCASKMQFC
jgi:phosphatidylserine/phosphatidylglycerophosphate/cardiolipin synthase-like enzyme